MKVNLWKRGLLILYLILRFKMERFRAQSLRAVHWHLQLMFEQLDAEKHSDIQNTGVICSLLPNLSCICKPIFYSAYCSASLFNIFEEIWVLLFHSEQKKLRVFSSLMWNFLLLVPEILVCLLCNIFRLDLEAVAVVPITLRSCLLMVALEYEILLA